MLNSMTGFGAQSGEIPLFGKISVEIRSTNHKFLDAVFHLPEGFLSLEEGLRRVVEAKIKRGRITCAVSLTKSQAPRVSIDKKLLKKYIAALGGIKSQLHIEDGLSLDTLIHLPGVLSLAENRIPAERIGPHIKVLAQDALEGLLKTRQKEGKALYFYLKNRAQAIANNLNIVRAKFTKYTKQKLAGMKIDDERSSFLKATDITEELERLDFHIRNFKSKLSSKGPIGKELDFIAQEMQREANTIGAKSSSAAISSRVVQIKSQIEKIREQVQNVE